jgi:hypothetical protein
VGLPQLEESYAAVHQAVLEFGWRTARIPVNFRVVVDHENLPALPALAKSGWL